MPNYNQAPILKFDIPKEKGSNYYELPQKLMDKIFEQIGTSSAQLRIMIVLIGTKPGFAVSEQWMLERTGMSHSSYMKARKQLMDIGWITLEKNDSKNSNNIVVNFKTICGT